MFNENRSAEATPSQILIIENDSDQLPKWKDLLKQADPSISFVWAFSEAEAREILFDSFMNDSKFDLIISKEEFLALSRELSIQVDQLQNSLDNLLHWSHSQMKGIDVNKEKTALNPLVLETLNLLQQNLSAKNIKIDLASPEDFLIDADPNHIKLVLRNFICNAIKYSYVGSSIALSAKKENQFIHFSVGDAGTGMTKEKAGALFMQNSIASQYGTSNEKGTGLGLMLCKEFIEKNGGSLFIESEIGKGSIFTFSVPAA